MTSIPTAAKAMTPVASQPPIRTARGSHHLRVCRKQHDDRNQRRGRIDLIPVANEYVLREHANAVVIFD